VDPEKRQRAVDLAYRAISRRERTESQLRATLARREVEPDLIDEAVADLQAAGYLDDAGYARRFAEDRRSIDGWGSDRIERDLLARGIAPELVAGALAGVGREAELEAAITLLDARVPVPPEDDRGRDRAWRMLVRRGYEPELAYEALRAQARRAAA
jgi:regulatory protein